MTMGLLLAITIVSVLRVTRSDIDGCTTATLINDVSKRGTGCIGTSLSKMLCDRQLIEGWYFAQHEGKMLSMPTTCPPMMSCGTTGGIWLNGTHPAGVNETVNGQGCVRGLPTDDNECCADTIPITVKNCGEFYAYYLPYTSTCDQAFCFGTQSCPPTTSTSQPAVMQQTTHQSLTGSDIDVCTTANLINDVSKRGTGCIATTLSNMLCDRQLIEGWYYAQHEGKMLSMPTTCPPMMSCGTTGGLWLNGTHPFGVNETVNVQGCVRGLPTDDNECCADTIPIIVKNCGEFYAYYLPYTSTCDQAFCFGTQSCPLTTSTSLPAVTQQTTHHSLTGESDPCNSASYIEHIWNRGTECNGLSLSPMICDRQLVQGWYRGYYNGETFSMPTQCPQVFGCGTAGPIWLNGTHPTVSDGIVERTGCRRGFESDVDICCVDTVSIKVQNCGPYFVYQLPYTKSCSEAYCFGSNSCQTLTTTQTLTSVESVPSQCVSAKQIPYVFLRGTECKGTELKTMVCDRQLTPGWYFSEYDGKKLTMPTTAPDMFTCGTDGPIWIKGSHPASMYDTVDVVGCKRGQPSDDDPQCSSIFPIQVTNCGNFYVYYLSYTHTCNEAYCFGNHSCTQHPGVTPSTVPFRTTSSFVEDEMSQVPKLNTSEKQEENNAVIVTICLAVATVITLLVLAYLVIKYWKGRRITIYKKKQPYVFPKIEINEKMPIGSEIAYYRNMQLTSCPEKHKPPLATFPSTSDQRDVPTPVCKY